MPGALSQNLPWLATAGNRVVQAGATKPVLLRGVNRSGLEYSEPGDAGFLAAAALTQYELHHIVQNWKSNVVRLPFNQDWALHGRNGHSAEEYLGALDQVIAWNAALGAYTILDLQWLDADTVYGHAKDAAGNSVVNRVAPTPNADTIALWNRIAQRYRDESAVLFDLMNEPHDPLKDDFLPIHIIGRNGQVERSDGDFVDAAIWSAWAARLVKEIRSVRPNGLILVAGVDWAFDLRSVRVNAPNILYSAHIYSNRPRRTWKRALGRASGVPVFVGEWGGADQDLPFGRDLAGVLRQQSLGWTAWSWVDYPQLIQPPRAPGYQPTAFGDLVRRELLA